MPTHEYPTVKLMVSANREIPSQRVSLFRVLGPPKQDTLHFRGINWVTKELVGPGGPCCCCCYSGFQERLRILNLAVVADGGPFGSCCCFSLAAGELPRTHFRKPTRTHRRPIRIVLLPHPGPHIRCIITAPKSAVWRKRTTRTPKSSEQPKEQQFQPNYGQSDTLLTLDLAQVGLVLPPVSQIVWVELQKNIVCEN